MKSSPSITASEAQSSTHSSGEESDLERVKQVTWDGGWGGGWKLDRGHRKGGDLRPDLLLDCGSREGLETSG